MRHSLKNMSGLVLMVSLTVLTGCSNALAEEMEKYMADMEEIHGLDEEFTLAADSLDYEYLPEELSSRSVDVDTERLESISTKLEEDILPVADQMAEEIETVEVNNEELAEMHDSFRESVEIKQDFARQLDEYVEAYLMSVRSNEELIELSQSFMENQKARDGIIEKTDDTDAVGEIDGLIEQINENSESLESESQLLQGDGSIDEKQKHIDEEMMPAIEEHIESLNQMNLETESAIRIRSLSLEMYYGFEKYYQERKNTMTYNERLQDLQLQSIIPMKETYQKLDENYYSRIDEIESELE
ncbi:MAG TPA: EMYY motif lipoprotein [Candidatus Salinicoccus stercoripullorum]|uniref:EMYY motif lipoprotein n=1 Tax=Candidatus Salinicoccus stercoripullorum TaxID=2838756 RepID=A0A9D1QGA9_9STAP|nr:EMYY motif lipoprotein [Candidatus Salinicoccus stercoripullorum]